MVEMNFKSDRKLEEVTKLLLARYPEFYEWGKSGDRLDENDGAYIYFGWFYHFLDLLVESQTGGEIIDRAFDFINEVFESDMLTYSVWNLFGIEFFERFEYDKNWGEMAHKKLKGKALIAFAERKGCPEKDEYHWSNQFPRTKKKRKRKT